MKRENTKSIAQVLDVFLEEEKLSEGMLENRILEAFRTLTEKRYGMKACRSLYIKEHTLYAWSESSVLKYTMNLDRQKLLEELNGQMQQDVVREIVIR